MNEHETEVDLWKVSKKAHFRHLLLIEPLKFSRILIVELDSGLKYTFHVLFVYFCEISKGHKKCEASIYKKVLDKRTS